VINNKLVQNHSDSRNTSLKLTKRGLSVEAKTNSRRSKPSAHSVGLEKDVDSEVQVEAVVSGVTTPTEKSSVTPVKRGTTTSTMLQPEVPTATAVEVLQSFGSTAS
jgi:hypothetical protein